MSINRRPRPLSPRPNPLPKNIKQKRNRNQRHGNKPQHRTSPPNAHIMEHNLREQRERSGEHTSEKRIRCNSRRSKFLKRIDEVVQRGLKDSEKSEAHEDRPDDGCYPVD